MKCYDYKIMQLIGLEVIPLVREWKNMVCTALLSFLFWSVKQSIQRVFPCATPSSRASCFPFSGAWGPGFFPAGLISVSRFNTASPPWCQIQSQNLGFLSIIWRFHKNGVTPKSSIFIGCSIINHPAIGDSPLLRNTFIEVVSRFLCRRSHRSSRAW